MTNVADLYEDCFFILISLLTTDAKKWGKNNCKK